MVHKIHRPHLKTARDARAIRTREALCNALLRLLELKPLEQITIRHICDVAKVGYTTFFRHHPSKESLLEEIAAEQIRQLVGMSLSAADAAEDMQAGSVAVCTYVDEHRRLWSTLLTGGAAGVMREEFIRLSREIATTRARPDVWPPADIVNILVGSSTIELLSWWLRQRKPLSIEEVAEIHKRLIITPVVSIAEESSRRVPRRPRSR
jgi:AcrR family transcriptional regulator